MICSKSEITPYTCRLCGVAPCHERARQLAVLAMKGAPCESSQHQAVMERTDNVPLELLMIRLCLSSQSHRSY